MQVIVQITLFNQYVANVTSDIKESNEINSD